VDRGGQRGEKRVMELERRADMLGKGEETKGSGMYQRHAASPPQKVKGVKE